MKPRLNSSVIASPAKPGVAIQLDCFVAGLLAMTAEDKP